MKLHPRRVKKTPSVFSDCSSTASSTTSSSSSEAIRRRKKKNKNASSPRSKFDLEHISDSGSSQDSSLPGLEVTIENGNIFTELAPWIEDGVFSVRREITSTEPGFLQKMLTKLELHCRQVTDQLKGKELEVQLLNRRLKEKDESISTEWNTTTTTDVLKEAALGNSEKLKYIYEYELEAKKTDFENELARSEKERNSAIKETQRLIEDRKRMQIHHAQQIKVMGDKVTMQRKRVAFLYGVITKHLPKLDMKQIPSFSNNPDDVKMVNIHDEYGKFLGQKGDEMCEDYFELELENGKVEVWKGESEEEEEEDDEEELSLQRQLMANPTSRILDVTVSTKEERADEGTDFLMDREEEEIDLFLAGGDEGVEFLEVGVEEQLAVEDSTPSEPLSIQAPISAQISNDDDNNVGFQIVDKEENSGIIIEWNSSELPITTDSPPPPSNKPSADNDCAELSLVPLDTIVATNDPSVLRDDLALSSEDEDDDDLSSSSEDGESGEIDLSEDDSSSSDDDESPPRTTEKISLQPSSSSSSAPASTLSASIKARVTLGFTDIVPVSTGKLCEKKKLELRQQQGNKKATSPTEIGPSPPLIMSIPPFKVNPPPPPHKVQNESCLPIKKTTTGAPRIQTDKPASQIGAGVVATPPTGEESESTTAGTPGFYNSSSSKKRVAHGKTIVTSPQKVVAPPSPKSTEEKKVGHKTVEMVAVLNKGVKRTVLVEDDDDEILLRGRPVPAEALARLARMNKRLHAAKKGLTSTTNSTSAAIINKPSPSMPHRSSPIKEKSIEPPVTKDPEVTEEAPSSSSPPHKSPVKKKSIESDPKVTEEVPLSSPVRKPKTNRAPQKILATPEPQAPPQITPPTMPSPTIAPQLATSSSSSTPSAEEILKLQAQMVMMMVTTNPALMSIFGGNPTAPGAPQLSSLLATIPGFSGLCSQPAVIVPSAPQQDDASTTPTVAESLTRVEKKTPTPVVKKRVKRPREHISKTPAPICPSPSPVESPSSQVNKLVKHPSKTPNPRISKIPPACSSPPPVTVVQSPSSPSLSQRRFKRPSKTPVRPSPQAPIAVVKSSPSPVVKKRFLRPGERISSTPPPPVCPSPDKSVESQPPSKRLRSNSSTTIPETKEPLLSEVEDDDDDDDDDDSEEEGMGLQIVVRDSPLSPEQEKEEEEEDYFSYTSNVSSPRMVPAEATMVHTALTAINKWVDTLSETELQSGAETVATLGGESPLLGLELSERSIAIAIFSIASTASPGLGEDISTIFGGGVFLRNSKLIQIVSLLLELRSSKSLANLCFRYFVDEVISDRNQVFRTPIQLTSLGQFYGLLLKQFDIFVGCSELLFKSLYWRPPDAQVIIMAMLRVNSEYFNNFDFKNRAVYSLRDRVSAFCLTHVPVKFQVPQYQSLLSLVKLAFSWVVPDLTLGELYPCVMDEILEMEGAKVLEEASQILGLLFTFWGTDTFPHFRDMLTSVTKRWLENTITDAALAAVIRAIGEMTKTSLEKCVTPTQLQPLKGYLEGILPHGEDSVVLKDALVYSLEKLSCTSKVPSLPALFPLLKPKEDKKKKNRKIGWKKWTKEQRDKKRASATTVSGGGKGRRKRKKNKAKVITAGAGSVNGKKNNSGKNSALNGGGGGVGGEAGKRRSTRRNRGTPRRRYPIDE